MTAKTRTKRRTRTKAASASATPQESGIERLMSIMARLRDPQSGCPWDIEQTFQTIAPYTIEEAYEVADAISRNNMQDLKEELGDLLLQVVYHSQMAAERGNDQGRFTFGMVADQVADKMIRRHPHVFGDASVDTAESQSKAWEDVKAEERKQKGRDDAVSLLDDVPLALPALIRSEKLQKRAARGGFDWPETDQVLDKMSEELEELEQEIKMGAPADRLEDELGDVLFTVANLARHLNLDPEAALRRTNRKFELRFREVEKVLYQDNKQMTDTPLDELETLWQAAKGAEKS